MIKDESRKKQAMPQPDSQTQSGPVKPRARRGVGWEWSVASGWWQKRPAETNPVKPNQTSESNRVKPSQTESNQGSLEIMIKIKIKIRSNDQELGRFRPGQTQSNRFDPGMIIRQTNSECREACLRTHAWGSKPGLQGGTRAEFSRQLQRGRERLDSAGAGGMRKGGRRHAHTSQ